MHALSRLRLLILPLVALAAGLLAAVPANARPANARPDVRAHIAGPFTPNDPGMSQAPGGWQSSQWNFIGPASVNAPEAWGHLIAAGRPGGRGVTIAVLDTGIAYRRFGRTPASPDLTRSQFVAGHDFVSNDPYANDRNGHGTHVASTIAETTNNGIGFTGLAYGVRIMPVKVLDNLGQGDSRVIARGVRFAVAHGAQILNMSLDFEPNITSDEIPELLSALNYARRRGVLVVAAAGNDRNSGTSSLSADGGPAGSQVAWPARSPNAIAVGATTEHLCLSRFSNVGPGLDIVAPGGGHDDTQFPDPGCQASNDPGRDIFQLTLSGATHTIFGAPSGYEGTSMAVSHVSATAALVIASGILGPHPSPAAIARRLVQTARDLGPPGYDTRYGYGLVNAAAATDPSVPVT